jgi:hypothetical protein
MAIQDKGENKEALGRLSNAKRQWRGFPIFEKEIVH